MAAVRRLLSWLLNVIWCGIFALVSPVLVYRMIRHGKYLHSWQERLLGAVPELDSKPGTERFWFHAVSVGEVLLLETVLEELSERLPTADVVISVTTSTGLDVARRKFPQHTVCCFPLDFTWAVRRAIQRISPTQIVLVELELWPNFILEAQRVEVPLSLINGRLSERSFRGYSRIGWLMRPLISSFDQLAVQTEAYAERFVKLGANPDRVTITGSVKFDRAATDRNNPATQRLRHAFELAGEEPVFVAGSTVAPEEDIVLNAWIEARKQCLELRLILVPRHKERFDEVAALIESHGLPVLRRSKPEETQPFPPESEERPVVLLDTLGELSACWGLADLAFVGGSMADRGGQNMIEPAGYGATVCFGPDTRNFRDVVTAMLDRDAAAVVHNKDELANTLQFWLNNRVSAQAQGQRAREFVLSQNGATSRTLDCLCNRMKFGKSGIRKVA